MRKGIDVLLSAYVETFRAHDDVTLVIKATGPVACTPGVRSPRSSRRPLPVPPGAPEVIYIDDDLSPSDMAGLYCSATCWCTPIEARASAFPSLKRWRVALP